MPAVLCLSAQDCALALKAIEYWLHAYDADREERDEMALLRIELLHYLKQFERRRADATETDPDPDGGGL